MENIKLRNGYIDFTDRLDDVAIDGSKTAPARFRLEKMDNNNYWLCFYPNFKRRKRYVFWIEGNKLKVEYREGE